MTKMLSLIYNECHLIFHLFFYFRALGLDSTFSGSEDPDEEQTTQNDSPFARLMDGKLNPFKVNFLLMIRTGLTQKFPEPDESFIIYGYFRLNPVSISLHSQ